MVLAEGRVLEHVAELLVPRHRVVNLVDLLLEGLDVARLNRLLRVTDEVVAHRHLHADDRRNHRIELVVDVARRDRRGTGNDERRTRLVDQDRVDFVNDREMMPVLHHLLGLLRHAVVAKVVEAEFAVRAVGDVAVVLRAALLGIHRILNAADGESKVLVEMSHPRRVALGEVVVHRDELHVLASKRIQVERHRRHQRLAFARLHLGNLALMEDNAADELDVERNHVPRERMSANLLGCADQVPARVFQKRKRLGQNLIKRRLDGRHLLILVRVLRHRLRYDLGHARLELGRPLREVLVRQVFGLQLLLKGVDLTNDRPQFLQLAFVLGTK